MYQPKHRKDEPSALEVMWARAKEKNKAKYAKFEKPYCQGFEDGMDGFVIHTPACDSYQDSAVSGSKCVDYVSDCPWPAGLSEVR